MTRTSIARLCITTAASALAFVGVCRSADAMAMVSANAILLPMSLVAPRAPAPLPQTAKRRATPGRAARAATVTGKQPTPVSAVLHFTTPRGTEALSSDLERLLNSKTRSGSWGAMVVSLTRGDTLFAQSPNGQFLPASTMKLFTTAIALERLGPDHTFSTDVLRDGTVDANGVLHGNLFLRGDGDPALSPRFVRGGPEASMDLMAKFTETAGIKHVTGDIIADASAFESRRVPEGWLTRYAGSAYAAPFSALSLDENIVIVSVSPNGSGSSANVALEPATKGITVTNTVKTIPGSGARIFTRRISDDHVMVSGTIGNQAGQRRFQLVVGDPATFAAGAFRSALESQGVKIDGDLKPGRAPEQATVVTGLPSPPLSRLVSMMNRESINHYAELLWRDAARGMDRSVLGSAQMADSVLQRFLVQQVGVAPNSVIAMDGSGLSVLDRVTPRSMVQLLSHAHRATWSSAFHASLPVAGESELLRRRMKYTPAQGNLHAKTGTTNEVIGLSGYVTAENGEILAFAFLYNGKDRWQARETIDAMGPTMAAFWRD